MQHLYIRADATKEIGTGHVMRCLALAQAWQDNGGSVTFLTHSKSESLVSRIVDEGFECVKIESPHPDPSDLEFTLEQLAADDSGPAAGIWVVIDGYHFDPGFHETIRKSGYRILVIDDTAHYQVYHADILLNQNIYAENMNYSTDADTVRLLGCRYTMLRKEFTCFRAEHGESRDKAVRILVTLGGSDPENITLKIARALKNLFDLDLEIKLIVGPANPNSEVIEKEITHLPFSSKVLTSVKDMRSHMSWADLAVTAGGSTCWELLFMRVPLIIITMAENQKFIGPCLEAAGAGIHIGWPYQWEENQLADIIKEISGDNIKRRDMEMAGRALIDGRGVSRIIYLMGVLSGKEIISKEFVRKANTEDSLQIWRLSNDPDVRKNSFKTDPIPIEEHGPWFEKNILSPEIVYFVIDVYGVIGAQIRYDKEGGAAKISFSVIPAFRGQRLGRKIIEWTMNRACSELSVGRVQGTVKTGNDLSMSIFMDAGFSLISEGLIQECECVVYEKDCGR